MGYSAMPSHSREMAEGNFNLAREARGSHSATPPHLLSFPRKRESILFLDAESSSA
jgi:hypothetical protein